MSVVVDGLTGKSIAEFSYQVSSTNNDIKSCKVVSTRTDFSDVFSFLLLHVVVRVLRTSFVK